MADVAPNAKPDSFKRRSTRIVQAVPLTVTGVDALGRPFEERTSTSIINCHGCRYQSKHYVLKNMWVTLEVPHPEQGRPPRAVRGRVMWIQRPRTVRELFQVGLELEVPGNLWGIAFCPPDWFPFPDSESEIQAPPPAQLHEGAVPEAEVLSASLEHHEQVPAEEPEAAGNLRTMPMAASPSLIDGVAGPSPTLARQMERLVAEAKQQLLEAIRDQAAETVSAQTQPFLTSLQEAAERSVQVAAATAADQAIQSAVGNAQAMAEVRLRELVDRWNDEVARSLEQYHQKLEVRTGEIGEERRHAFEQQFQSQVEQRLNELAIAAADSRNTVDRARENLEAVRRQAEDSISAAVRDGALHLQAQTDDARTRVSEIETVLRNSIEQVAPASASAQIGWKAQQEEAAAAAAKSLDDRVESSIESAAQKVSERLEGAAQAASERFEKQLSERISGISQTFMEATADAESRLAAAHASLEDQAGQVQALLTQLQSAGRPVAEQTAQLDSLINTAQQELERRLAALVDRQTQELARHAESSTSSWSERLQPAIENAQQELERRATALVDSQAQELARRAESSTSSWSERLQPSIDAAQNELERRAANLVEIHTLELSRRADAAASISTERLQPALDAAQQELERRAAALVENQSQELARRAEAAASVTTERLQPALEAAQQELERRAAALVEIQNQELARRAESALASWTERLQPSLETAQHELERRAATLVEIQSQELDRRGEFAMSTWTERLQPSLEAAAQETVARLGAQFEQHLGSHLDRAHQVLGRLEYESLAAAEALHKREETLSAASNRIVESATTQLQRQIETLQHDFQEAGRQAAAQWLAEIDSKATETTHTTFESLFKTSEWYEKKVQAHMQTTLERGLEQGVDQLRDKAGEISRLFAGELDHYSRSYVEHAHEQIEEAGNATLERTRRQSAEMTSASISSLTQQMQNGSDAAMRDFHAKTGAALGKLAAQAEEQAAQTSARIEAAAQHLAVDFGSSITQYAQQALGIARQELTSQANAASDSLRAEADAREKHLREALASASDQGIESYKQRLESAANSWLLTTVSKLNQDSQQQLGALTRAAETRLRDTCKQVFANVGEALRQQMLDLPLSAPPKDSNTSDKTT